VVYKILCDFDPEYCRMELLTMLRSSLQPMATASRLLALIVALVAPQIGSAGGGPTEGTTQIAAADLEHGRKLYEVSCDACHNANVHWRDKRLVDSWPALLHQVDRWQHNSNQRWEATDVNDVAAYLNERFYHLPCPANECAAKAAVLSPETRMR
jgi:mono/diheme cytochrome c family protein